MEQFVYALYYDDVPTGRRYFYVGVSKNVAARMKQHHYSKAKGHEDKYEYIRRLEQRGTAWDVETLKSIPAGTHPPDNERWYVIQLIRQGHDLMNMKHGNRTALKEIARQVKDLQIRNVEDVARAREAEEQVRAVRAFTRKKRLQRSVLRKTLLEHGIPNMEHDKVLTPRLRSRCIKAGYDSVGKGVTLKDLVAMLRGRARFDDLVQLLAYRQ